MYASTKVFDDTKIEEIEALPLTQPHRLVDSTIAEADTEGRHCSRCGLITVIHTGFSCDRLRKDVHNLSFDSLWHRQERVHRQRTSEPLLNTDSLSNSRRT